MLELMRVATFIMSLTLFMPTARSAGPVEAALQSGTCFARGYDAKHLREHPRQTVMRFHVVRDANGNAPLAPGVTWVRFGFAVKGSSDVFDSLAACRQDGAQGGAKVMCLIEGDGGSFQLSLDADRLRVTIGDRVEVEGAASFSPDLARGDNRIMLLQASPRQACAR